jgi:hypothetical protein
VQFGVGADGEDGEGNRVYYVLNPSPVCYNYVLNPPSGVGGGGENGEVNRVI